MEREEVKTMIKTGGKKGKNDDKRRRDKGKNDDKRWREKR